MNREYEEEKVYPNQEKKGGSESDGAKRRQTWGARKVEGG